MALERQSIDKKDFPIGRRGYDPEAVDAHLSALAHEIEELRASSQATRERAIVEAREYVGKVSEATNVMLQRIDAMESELTALIESMRTGMTRLTTDLQLLETNLGDVREASGPRPRFEPEVTPTPAEGADVHPVRGRDVAEQDGAAPGPAAGGSDDAEGARLIALNMALDGTPRDETDRYLAENFSLSDRGRLIDEVYAGVEG